MKDKTPSPARVAKKWKKLPPGWTDKSVEKFWGTLTGTTPEHKVWDCVSKMEKVFGDGAGAFCGGLADWQMPGWREKNKKESPEARMDARRYWKKKIKKNKGKKAMAEWEREIESEEQSNPLLTEPDYGTSDAALPRGKEAKIINTIWVVEDPTEQDEIIDMIWSTSDMQQFKRIMAGSGHRNSNMTLHDDERSAVADATKRLNRVWKGDIPDWVFANARQGFKVARRTDTRVMKWDKSKDIFHQDFEQQAAKVRERAKTDLLRPTTALFREWIQRGGYELPPDQTPEKLAKGFLAYLLKGGKIYDPWLLDKFFSLYQLNMKAWGVPVRTASRVLNDMNGMAEYKARMAATRFKPGDWFIDPNAKGLGKGRARMVERIEGTEIVYRGPRGRDIRVEVSEAIPAKPTYNDLLGYTGMKGVEGIKARMEAKGETFEQAARRMTSLRGYSPATLKIMKEYIEGKPRPTR